MIKNNINEVNKNEKWKTELVNNVIKDEDKISRESKDSDKEFKEEFRTGGWIFS